LGQQQTILKTSKQGGTNKQTSKQANKPNSIIMSFSSFTMLLFLISALLFHTHCQAADNNNQADKSPFPDYFIIGAQKCGTTSLTRLLVEHPQVCYQNLLHLSLFPLPSSLLSVICHLLSEHALTIPKK
jgi:hypothetical protein